MFAKQQDVSDLNKPRDTYNDELQKGKEMGWRKQRRASLRVGQKRTPMTFKEQRRCMQETVHASAQGKT